MQCTSPSLHPSRTHRHYHSATRPSHCASFFPLPWTLASWHLASLQRTHESLEVGNCRASGSMMTVRKQNRSMLSMSRGRPCWTLTGSSSRPYLPPKTRSCVVFQCDKDLLQLSAPGHVRAQVTKRCLARRDLFKFVSGQQPRKWCVASCSICLMSPPRLTRGPQLRCCSSTPSRWPGHCPPLQWG